MIKINKQTTSIDFVNLRSIKPILFKILLRFQKPWERRSKNVVKIRIHIYHNQYPTPEPRPHKPEFPTAELRPPPPDLFGGRISLWTLSCANSAIKWNIKVPLYFYNFYHIVRLNIKFKIIKIFIIIFNRTYFYNIYSNSIL